MSGIKIICFGILIGSLGFAQTDSTLIDISEKKAELNEKNVEVLELQSNLSNHDGELQTIRDEIEKLKTYNKRLQDSLLTKQVEIDSLREQQNQVENFKMIVTAFDEDKALTDEILESIKASDAVPENTVSAVPDVDDSEYRTLYNEALNLYFDRDYPASIERFRKLLAMSQRHPLADNCQYWLGENLYSQEKYSRAIEEFKKVGPLGDGNKADAALFKIGMSYLKMEQQSQALSAFKQLEKQFPDSELLGKAQQYLTTQEKF
ncbi:MAG: tetratricopeptide repeat protein [Candidatus Marinimicrobia bacterium]|nr:tetratricopeptide repeat protein [Candidatus Neomarinimicrobiota bacterium]